MNTSTRMLLVTIFTVVCGWSVAIGQQAHPSEMPASFARLGQAFAAFSVDESASKTGKISQPRTNTVVAGPIELHLPKLTKPAWMESIANRKPPAKKRLQEHAASHHVQAQYQQSTTNTVARAVKPTGARHSITPHDSYEVSTDELDAEYVLGFPSPSHQVIRSPGQSQPTHHSVGVGQNHDIHEKVEGIHKRYQQTHPEHCSIHQRVQPEPATIPGGREQEIWKQPYSYGYFGASGERHWSKQYGYRDRYTQWTRR